jgi:nicotinamide mononucleotide transporter
MTLPETLRALLREPPWLELGANAANLVSIVLATRNSVHTWWTGFAGCGLFGWLFFSAKLYADVTLQVFFFITGALGWWQWLHREGRRADRPVTRAGLAQFAWMLPASLAAALGYGWLLHRFTDAYAPFFDALVLTLSVTAQLLLMQRRLETWFFWFLANSVSVPLCASRGLWLTAFFYALFWLNAPAGYLAWRRALRAAAP